ncbi:AraC family transcriptional regulator [Simiduia aestuariiviva]|uniref:AraC-like DNA-binding protein n=1 Tax=Simiduia aestuariiviva TaxID=1510459 RepID=A0A839UKG7_9GAMM|nr:AraC family transcriptional regulator [Simiduia aestuariiviva]MBB3167100.1 AraC-like DNA-binding protein [Simiduia aestuariiviva]
MSTHPQTVAACYVRHLIAGAEAEGVDTSTLLPTDIHAELNSDHWRMPVEDYVALMHAVWHATQDESAGYCARPLKPGTFAMLCHATIDTPNLRRALLRAIKFFQLLSDDLTLQLTENEREASITLSHTGKAALDDLFFIETLALILIRWSSWMIDKKLLVSRIDFSAPTPAQADERAHIFGCTPHFAQAQNRICFATRFLNERVAQNSQTLANFLAQAPVSLLSHYQRDTSLSAQVRQLLQCAVDGDEGGVEQCGLEQIAEQLHLTSQTLRRRLKEEGNSFQEIKDAVRCALAIHYLVRDDLPVQDIAEKMGFSEASVFFKAFKRWTGLTPGAYRERELAK